MKTLEVYLSEEEINEQDCIDSLRQDGKWDDVKKQHKQYIRLLKQKKEFTSRYKSEEERVALNACPNFPVLILPGMGLILRMQWPWQRLFN